MGNTEQRCQCGCGTQTLLDRNGNPRRFLQGHNRRGKGNGWIEQGHRYISVDGKRIAEHRFVVEQRLGRSLGSNEVVHHIDHDGLNNDPDNLIVMSPGEHMRLHRLQKKGRRWTRDEKARAVERYLAGMSLDEVAVSLGRPYSSTKVQIAKAGVSRRPHETSKARQEQREQELPRAA